jgi:conjugal transfer pilus assembly protein TraI
VIVSIAEWFNCLPLSPDLHDEAGGAFRASLDSAFFTLRLAGASIFTSDLPSQERRRLEPQFRYGAFLAAISAFIDEPYRHYVVYADSGQEWTPAVHGSIKEAAGKAKLLKVDNRIPPLPVSKQRAAVITASLIRPYILALDPKVQNEIFNALQPDPMPHGLESVLHRVVRQGIGQAIEVERKAKSLLSKPAQREVTSAVDLKVNAEGVPMASQAATSNSVAAEAAHTSIPQSSDKVVTQQKVPERISLDALSSKLTRQYLELVEVLASDIRDGRKSHDNLEWRETGLMVPTNIFAQYGKPERVVVDALQKAGLVLGQMNKQILLAPELGQVIFPQ